jgi:hypothetical protein
MRDAELKEKYESLYRERVDPWDYWTSEYEHRKYHEQISLVAQFGTPKRILEIACSTGAHTKQLLLLISPLVPLLARPRT